MDLWQRFTNLLGSSVEAMGGLFDRLTALISGDPEDRRQMTFSVAIVALSAKMAKADGVVTFDEIAAFKRLVAYPESQARHVERLFDLARRDVAGYESYAAKIAGLCEKGDPILTDIIDALFVIAGADSLIHEAEIEFLSNVASVFELTEREFETIKARHVLPEEGDPYLIIGGERSDSFDELKRRYRELVAENHPDRLIARGVPPEFIALANHRLAAINVAWDRIEVERRPA
ncbi:MAG: TerB family tellurite resistance protein [Alphaproteobacteria bacterium]